MVSLALMAAQTIAKGSDLLGSYGAREAPQDRGSDQRGRCHHGYPLVARKGDFSIQI